MGVTQIIDFAEKTKPSQLETEYVELYGKQFVDDLKRAYWWMKLDMKKQPPQSTVLHRRAKRDHISGEWRSVFYVDFRKGELISVTIDEKGDKTSHNLGHSPCLKATKNNRNIRYLLSGMFFYDKKKTKEWLDELVGKGEKFLDGEA